MRAAAREYRDDICIAEYTINNDKADVLADIYGRTPDVLAFSCYIWNIAETLWLCEALRRVLPSTVIVLGGPEVSYDPERYTGLADYVVSGEGEQKFYDVLRAIDGKPPGEPSFHIPFPYEDGLGVFDKRIIYYETQRGCPFKCAYCLSGGSGGVRYLPMDQVFRELDIFLAGKIRQLKFVDRTFNSNKGHSRAIWRYLIEKDNGITNFHFELAAELLEDEDIDLLENARPGLFQFEIGVQSANETTLRHIRRQNALSKILGKVKKLGKLGNINIHLDLIAGLPGEDYQSFGRSFDFVFGMKPDQLQLGFLKLLKGSALWNEAERFGLKCSPQPPYEVLCTPELSYGDIVRLKRIEDMVEQVYNSGKFERTLSFALPYFKGGFDYFERLAEHRSSEQPRFLAHSKLSLYDTVYSFLSSCGMDAGLLRDALKFDMLANENMAVLPDYLPAGNHSRALSDLLNGGFRAKYAPETVGMYPKQAARKLRIERFGHNLDDGSEQECYILFNYDVPLRNGFVRSFRAAHYDITAYMGDYNG